MRTKMLTTLTQFGKQYTPEILSGLAIAGVVTTAYLTHKATVKQEVANADRVAPYPANLWEKTKEDWKFYVPPMLSGAATICCIIGASRIGHRRNAALAAGMALADRAFQEYKDEVKELLGERKALEVEEKIAQKRIDQNPPSQQVLIAGGGEMLCYERLTGRYFRGDIETIRRAENEINAHIIQDMYASQNEFYALIGLNDVDAGEELGWNMDHLIKCVFTSHLDEHGTPCLAIGYEHLPIPHYGKVF